MSAGQPFLRALRLAWIFVGTAAAALAPQTSHACGACVEDNVTATYDHQVVTRAKMAGNDEVLCQISGSLAHSNC